MSLHEKMPLNYKTDIYPGFNLDSPSNSVDKVCTFHNTCLWKHTTSVTVINQNRNLNS